MTIDDSDRSQAGETTNPGNALTTSSDVEDSSSFQSASKKRSRDTESDELILSPEVLAKMSRSERKRHRERKRRNDVNRGFEDLMDLLLEIDPVVKAEAAERSHRGHSSKGNNGTSSEESLLSRVELIGRTVEVLRKTHIENEQRKLLIQQLLQRPSPQVTSLPGLQHAGLAGLGAPAPAGNMEQLLTGLTSLPSLRPNQAAVTLPSSLLANPYRQLALGAATTTNNSLGAADLLALARAQSHALPNLMVVPAPGGQAPQLQSQLPVSMLHQLNASNGKSVAGPETVPVSSSGRSSHYSH